MASIYLLKCEHGCQYIGATTQKLSVRISEHKSTAKTGRGRMRDCRSKGHARKYTAIALETCDESIMFDREKYWISVFSGTLLNRTDGGKGPNGMIATESERNTKSVNSKKAWARDDGTRRAAWNLATKTFENQSKKGKLGAASRWKDKYWIEAKTTDGKLVGRFRTAEDCSKSVGVSVHKIYKSLSGYNAKKAKLVFSKDRSVASW